MSIMDKITADVAKHVMEQVNSILLPAIAEKYGLPLEELQELPNQIPKRTIKAKPKVVKPEKEVSKKPTELEELQKKIADCRKQGKFLNTATGRPLADTKANRGKITFHDKLGIAGKDDDSKFVNALRLLGVEESEESSSEYDIPTEESTTPVKKKVEPKKKVVSKSTPPPEDVEQASKSKKKAATKQTEEEKPKTKSASKKEVADDDESSTSKKSATKKTKEKAKKKVEEDEDIDSLTKITELIEKGENDDPDASDDEDEEESPQALTVRWNKELHHWWNEASGFIIKRKGIKSIVIGRAVPGGKVVQLSPKDLKKCKENGWAFDTTVLVEDDDDEEEED